MTVSANMVTTSGVGIQVDGEARGTVTGNTISFLPTFQGASSGRVGIQVRDTALRWWTGTR